ncbi:MAG: MBL fold metallo-hydrolase [Blastocatellia bacterium]|nr:MBL fold metallo-hydrolase [Blastocatellia bacterium]
MNKIGCLLIALLVVASARGQQLTPDTSMLTDGKLHVVMCGTGSPLPDANRASACVAVIAGGEFVLIDAGPNSWRTAALNRLPAQNLSAVLLTHFHSDHIGDLGEAVTQSWIAGRARKLEVYGPPGVEGVVAGFAQAYSLDVGYRVAHHSEEMMPRAAAGATARTVTLKSPEAAATVFERNGLKVTAFRVEHDPATPAYGYRLEYRGRAVVISGDAKKSENIARHAAGADLLIHDVLAKSVISLAAANAERGGDPRRARMARDILAYHAGPEEVAETAAAAKVETLVFTHMVPAPNAPMIEQAFMRGVSDRFKGAVVLARDGQRFDLPPKE